MDLAAFGRQLVDQFLRFRRVAPGDADLVAAFGKAAGHRGANGIAGTDQQGNTDPIRHRASDPIKFLFGTEEFINPGRDDVNGIVTRCSLQPGGSHGGRPRSHRPDSID